MYSTQSITTASTATLSAPLGLGVVDPMAADPSAGLCVLVSPAVLLPGAGPAATPLDIAHHFANVPDPRHPAFCDRHLLSDILVIALSAMLCGCKSWEAIADF